MYSAARQAAGVTEGEEGEVFGPDAAVGVEVEVPEVAGVTGALAVGGFEDTFVSVVHVAVAVGVAKAAEKLVQVVAAGLAVAVAIEEVARRITNLVSVDGEAIAP